MHNARLNNADVIFQEDDVERYLKKAIEEGNDRCYCGIHVVFEEAPTCRPY